MKKTLLICFAFSFAIAGRAQTPPIQPKTPDVKIPPALQLTPPKQVELGKEPLTMTEAIAIAIKNQPNMGIAEGNLTSAKGKTQQAKAGELPSITIGGSSTDQKQLKGAAPSNPQSRYSANATLDQLLFDFGRTRDQIRQQSALERAFAYLLTRAHQTVVLSVKQSFYDLTQDRRLVVIAEDNVQTRQRQLDLAQARLDSGLGAPADVVRAKTNLADAAISLSSARSTALNSQVDLAQQLGIDPRTPVTLANESEEPAGDESDLEKLVAMGLEHRPDLKDAQERVSAAKFAISAAKKDNLPRVSAFAGMSTRGADDLFNSQSRTLGISLSWTFGDGGLSAGRVRDAQGQEKVAQEKVIQLGQQVVAEISQAFTDLQSAQQRVELSQVQFENAKELVRISEGRYEGGIGQFLEVTDAQSLFVSAQRNLAQAEQDVSRARSRLKAAIGAE